MLKRYGTIDIRHKSVLRQTSKHHSVVVKAKPDVENAIDGLIGPENMNPVTFLASGQNVLKLNMILSQYPMSISGKDRWRELLMEKNSRMRIQQTIADLAPVTPDPRRFLGILMPFQKLGLDFLLKSRGNALIADEMGLGKTVQTLAFVAQRPDVLPMLVVAPLVTLENWRREIVRFLRLGKDYHYPQVKIIRSGKEGSLEPADFYLINYELIHKRMHDIMDAGPRLVVFDEIQNLRHPRTYKMHACTEIAGHESVHHRIGLSGTPIYNNGMEVYEIAESVMPGIFGSKEQFQEMFYDFDYDYGGEGFMVEKLSTFLKENLLIRRMKAEVLAELPKKNRVQQVIPTDLSMYEERIRELYMRIEVARDNLSTASEGVERRRRLTEFNSLLMEMRVAERQLAGLAKAPHVVEYIKELLEDYEDEKFVIFCHHRSVHKILIDGLQKYHPMQIIGGQSDAERQDAIDRFQTNKGDRIIICGLRAGNVGINLTEASYVIFAELDWSPAVHAQAEDRLHRIGQKSSVFAHYIIGAGTFDEYLAEVLTAKGDAIRKVLGDAAETNNKKALELLEKRFGSRVMGEVPGSPVVRSATKSTTNVPGSPVVRSPIKR